ncbi:MAG: acyl-CoA/acyl-ACP dehydrogenase [Leptospiraceae bacterium]|nr:acyl-CoA/acyl-ACP dehydrogenase [Leptospiraceae bacterium]
MQSKISQLNQLSARILNEVTTYLAGQANENGRISVGKMDENQTAHYNLAWYTAEVRVSENLATYAFDSARGTGELEQDMAFLFAGETLNRLRSEVAGKPAEYGVSPQTQSEIFTPAINAMIQEATGYERYNRVGQAALEGNFGALSLDEDQVMLRDTFRQFAEDKVIPKAEHIHRTDDIIPDDFLSGLAELGAFGLSIPGEYEGYMDAYGNVGMMVVTEELSRGSLATAGSLITRPEILSKAIIKGGTPEQKQKWLPKLATGEVFNAVAVTEPNYGSDVAGMSVTADKVDGGWVINGVKTWCTFAGYADVLLVLARTEKDPGLKHKGLSILLAEKPRSKEHKFEHTQSGGGKMEGSAIPTIGYRGMHSYEVSFDNYFVPDENLIGGEEGRGKGFYLQMAGFAGGRIQTAARANGVMQAALEAAVRYCNERKVFGKEIGKYQISLWKVARMAMIIQASRQFSAHVARLMDQGQGAMEATLIKFYASKIAEWVTREAMQLHGGMGYAEEYAVSRYYVDARVFSIFEGAEEVMALRVCARDLLAQALGAAS